jgi:hypothetical protein
MALKVGNGISTRLANKHIIARCAIASEIAEFLKVLFVSCGRRSLAAGGRIAWQPFKNHKRLISFNEATKDSHAALFRIIYLFLCIAGKVTL